MDSGYGSAPGLLRQLDAEGETYVAEVHCDQRLWQDHPWPHRQAAQRVDEWSRQQPEVLADNGTRATALVKTGVGAWELTNTDNTYSGGTAVNGGLLRVTDSNALGSGSITISGTELRLSNGVTTAIGNSLTINCNTGFMSAILGPYSAQC